MDPKEKLRLAEKMAKEMSSKSEKVDVNELGKLFAHLRRYKDFPKTINLLKALINSPFKRSKRTESYYRNALKVINRNLSPQIHNKDALEILGWTVRLMKYEPVKNADKHFGTLGTMTIEEARDQS